jgi:hypothetical protein
MVRGIAESPRKAGATLIALPAEALIIPLSTSTRTAFHAVRYLEITERYRLSTRRKSPGRPGPFLRAPPRLVRTLVRGFAEVDASDRTI